MVVKWVLCVPVLDVIRTLVLNYIDLGYIPSLLSLLFQEFQLLLLLVMIVHLQIPVVPSWPVV